MNGSTERDLLNNLTDEQKAAVLAPHEGRLKIVAGAGSGKTEVLTRRISSVLASGVSPRRIAAITYTNKAAIEMKDRLVEKRGLKPEIFREMTVSTFHAFLSKLLRKDPFAAGMDIHDKVLTENARRMFTEQLVEKFCIMHADALVNGQQALDKRAAKRLIENFPRALGKIRRFLLSPAEFYKSASALMSAAHGSNAIEQNSVEWLFRFFALYLQQMEAGHFLDFDEILMKGSRLINAMLDEGRIPDQDIFLIDEFQDNNSQQLGIIARFTSRKAGHLCVVGDERQSIYGFQGADPDAFRKFAENNRIVLSGNFRSYLEIIRFSHEFLSIGIPDESEKLPPNISYPGPSKREKPVACLCSESSDDDFEADTIVKMIRRIVEEGLILQKTGETVRYGDIAVIVRSIRLLPKAFEDALLAEGIPYVMSGGMGFYDRSEIADIVAFLRLITTPQDDHAATKILTGPLFGIPDSKLAHIAQSMRAEKTNLLAHILALPENLLPARISDFRKLYLNLKAKSETLSLLEILYHLLENAGFLEYAASQGNHLKRRRMENNLNKFLDVARDFEQSGVFSTLRDFLDYLDRFMASEIEEDEAGLGLEEGDAVRILTVHKAKGLEFPIVFTPFLKRRKYRRTDVLDFSCDYGLMVNLGDLNSEAHKEKLKAFYSYENVKHDSEERRRLYVAFSRAEELLIISGSSKNALTPGETLFDTCAILEKHPELGSISSMVSWETTIDKWLTAGQNRAEKHLPVSQSIAEDIPTLKSSIETYCEFSRRLGAASKGAEDSAGPLKANIISGREAEVFALAELELFETCKRRYFYMKRGFRALKEPHDTISEKLGSLIHRVLRLYHSRNADFSDSAQNARDLKSILVKTSGISHLPDNMQRKASVILDKYLGHRLAMIKPDMLEAEANLRLQTDSGPFFIRGFADRVDRDGPDINVIDYKTHAYDKKKHESYERQMALYLTSARRGILGDIGKLNFAETQIAYLGEDGTTIERCEADAVGFEIWASHCVDSIRKEKQWLPTASVSCNNCEYKCFCSQISPAGNYKDANRQE